jgi:hypothetical protein
MTTGFVGSFGGSIGTLMFNASVENTSTNEDPGHRK